MQDQPGRETLKVDGGQLLDRFKQLVHEGNVRRVVVKQDEHVVAEFPLTIGVVGAVIAPVLAAVGALAALLTNCTIEIERTDQRPDDTAPSTSEPEGTLTSPR